MGGRVGWVEGRGEGARAEGVRVCLQSIRHSGAALWVDGEDAVVVRDLEAKASLVACDAAVEVHVVVT